MKPSQFRFLNPYLDEISFLSNQHFVKDEKPIAIENSFQVQVNREKDENKAHVQLTLKTNAENENAPFKIVIKMSSDFEWEDMDESVIDTMLHINAPALLLGYMRPLVATITNSSKYPVYNLPFINFNE